MTSLNSISGSSSRSNLEHDPDSAESELSFVNQDEGIVLVQFIRLGG